MLGCVWLGSQTAPRPRGVIPPARAIVDRRPTRAPPPPPPATGSGLLPVSAALPVAGRSVQTLVSFALCSLGLAPVSQPSVVMVPPT